MSIEQRGHMPLDYQPVNYPGSMVRFRGPAADLAPPFVLCLGAAETFGRFIDTPYPTLLARRLTTPVVNLGVPSAGLDVMLCDPVIRDACANATEIVLQITGAANMNNRFYSVHPRRNDRFVKASSILRTIYPEVDFTEFHFCRHLLTHLKGLSRERFALVEDELRTAWTARMKRFIANVGRPVHLLWLSLHQPGDPKGASGGIGRDPLFITQSALQEVAQTAASLSVVVPSAAGAGHPTRGKFFAAREEQAARTMPGPDLHQQAFEALLPRLKAARQLRHVKTPRLV